MEIYDIFSKFSINAIENSKKIYNNIKVIASQMWDIPTNFLKVFYGSTYDKIYDSWISRVSRPNGSVLF